jgi:hypothetical protein
MHRRKYLLPEIQYRVVCDGTKAVQRRFSNTFFPTPKESPMFKPVVATMALMACALPAFAVNDYPSATMQTALPSEALTVTDWYKQNVYDPNENKIGDIKDVLLDKSGRAVALIVGVGGFLGAGCCGSIRGRTSDHEGQEVVAGDERHQRQSQKRPRV